MNVSRRFFIGGASAFGALGAFGGARFLIGGGAPSGKPNLRFGVVSDIHIDCIDGCSNDSRIRGTNETFRKTLEYFRSQDVDAVVIAGDMADLGMGEQLMAVADAWYKVFPNDKYPDGRPVEKVFIYGNHDWRGYTYQGGYAKKIYPDENERVKHIIQADMAGWWRRAFREDYSPLYAKVVNGYTFIGQHWDKCCGYPLGDKGGVDPHVRIKDYLAEHGKRLDPKLPFFYIQHPHPKDTCYGSWAWGHDTGVSTAALSAFSNAIAFSGHSHYSLTDERSVWQGAFTSVGTASLRYGAMTSDEYNPVGYENTGGEGAFSGYLNAHKISPNLDLGDVRQGMLWSIYDDCAVVKRRDFVGNLDLGDDWVLPLPAAESRPFAFVEHAKKIAAPEFVEGQEPTVEKVLVRSRGGTTRKQNVPAIEREAWKVTAPACVAERNARVMDIEFVAEGADGVRIRKLVAAEGYSHSEKDEKALGRTSCCFNVADFLPQQSITFAMTPRNCFHKRGKTMSVSVN